MHLGSSFCSLAHRDKDHKSKIETGNQRKVTGSVKMKTWQKLPIGTEKKNRDTPDVFFKK